MKESSLKELHYQQKKGLFYVLPYPETVLHGLSPGTVPLVSRYGTVLEVHAFKIVSARQALAC